MREEGVVAAQNLESSGVDGVAFRNTSNGKLARRFRGRPVARIGARRDRKSDCPIPRHESWEPAEWRAGDAVRLRGRQVLRFTVNRSPAA